MQYTAYLFQIPVFNYNMLTENSGHTGISSFIFAHIFQVIPDILKGKFFFLAFKELIAMKGPVEPYAKMCAGDNSRSY